MYRLLIADDEESIREGVADFVRRSCPGWEIAALARDGREALALARETLPDAVLTDIAMPHMNGLDFLESLSSILPEAKLLVLSGYDQFEYAVQALRIGVGDYLLKPLDTAKLIAALDRFAAELDAQALRWTQAETLRAGVQRSSALELQGFFPPRFWAGSFRPSARHAAPSSGKKAAAAVCSAKVWTTGAAFWSVCWSSACTARRKPCCCALARRCARPLLYVCREGRNPACSSCSAIRSRPLPYSAGAQRASAAAFLWDV